ncbi:MULTISPECIES: PTS transporter subunit EIIC [Vibrio]|uniref:PTS transporter subunit EIIC n=1 Tax=Vibrio TaxID=662 RepID=UPI002075C548|nr:MULTISPECIES: PTS transporter subunit EIIC [Vibrio]USD31653.1 PTS transporter subunit EIIC [Vibrio sp. SCSIO 43186]USD44697.1 PTS transporter subunit EIIC [Vibrio sp. SCSIO 43145]USD68776.1 PTS transporter subunit EIIC [Vibrio sp. SCSIO 43139]USD96466.1 PTS sugar transporter subunit IIA [Vibrio coralliilyticus]
MARDANVVANTVMASLGGEANIAQLNHCATRLRVVAKDDSKVDAEGLSATEGVHGYFFQNGQHQVILGTGFVGKVFAIMKGNDSVEETIESEEKKEKVSAFQAVTRTFSDIFVAIIPALVATGLLMGLRGLLVNGFGVELSPQLNILSQVLTDTAFIFIPVLVTWSAMRVFGGNPVLGIVLGLMLVAPQLASKWDVAFGNAEALMIPFMGFDIAVTGLQSSILPAVFMGWFAAMVERTSRKYIPEVLDLIITPFITLLVSLIAGLVFVGPILLGAEKLITEAVLYFLQIPYGIGGLIYGGAIQFMAVTGMHHTIVPITIAMVTDTGFDFINPLGTAAIAGQFGAAMAVMTMQTNKVKRSGMFGATLPALFGITEPAMFAVTLPRVKPFLYGCLGGAIGGCIGAIAGIGSAGTGATMLPGILLYLGGGLGMYIVVMLVGAITAFALTKLFYKEPETLASK